jgi:hypothetical protein
MIPEEEEEEEEDEKDEKDEEEKEETSKNSNMNVYMQHVSCGSCLVPPFFFFPIPFSSRHQTTRVESTDHNEEKPLENQSFGSYVPPRNQT